MNENSTQPDISLRLLEIFGAMMRCETTVEAAEQLGISQPAVSNGIRQLESQLGVTLFERLHRRLQPTEEALILYKDVQPVFSLVRSFASRARDMRQGRSGHLRIIATPPLGNTIAPVALRNFLKEKPEVSVSYDVRRLEHVLEAVKSGAADLGIALSLDRHPAVNVEVLARTHMVAVITADAPLAEKASISAGDLHSGTFIGLEAESHMGQILRAAFERDGAIYDPRVEVRYCSTAAVLAQTGLGVAIIDPYSAAFQQNGQVGNMVLRPFQPPSAVTVVMFTRKGVPRSRLLHAFITDLKQAVVDFHLGQEQSDNTGPK
ncbi:LysR family transcriptional regulator [Agrobacterium rhizogenes]|jgi:DNA-binding transcriptional LysR family regulator|nr:LysR family transcriptional regulator [Rhizobium rhizogenes]NTH99949.1 LysR family transcriptional regulator [Rhizobium rhizogenes]NTJ18241.1 LysR family transcriptional regulator [Rhizobium rhizogenes]